MLPSHYSVKVVYRPKRSLGQGNILHLFVILFTGGVCVWLPGGIMVVGGHACGRGHAWLPGACMVAGGVWWCGGACMVAGGGMCGCRWCAWLWGHAWLWGVCMVVGGMYGCGGHAWLWGWGVHRITTKYGQWVGSMHPTGMHSCYT